MKKLVSKVTKKPLIPALFILCLIIVGYFILPAHLRSFLAGVNGFSDIDLTNSQKILIFAPHNDDETLSSAGLIQDALAQGKEVRVVISTNGDGYVFATMEEFRTFFPSGADYIRMGDIRQEESIRALSVLGLPESTIYFLGYPDRGTPSLWDSFWGCSIPYRSPFTDTSNSLYKRTYDSKAKYCGADLLADIRSILNDYKPDTIILPHPEDAHPDHWGLSNFVRLAVIAENEVDPIYQPLLFAYLVHRPDYPVPAGLHSGDSLMPPLKLLQIRQDWLKLDVSNAQLSKKAEAIAQYKSQLPLLHTLLHSFIRSNELFEPEVPLPVPYLNTVQLQNDPTTWIDDTGAQIQPIIKDPINDFITRDALGDTDIVALYAARDHQNRLYLCGQLKDEIGSMPFYRLQIRGDATSQYKMVTLTYHNRFRQNSATASGTNICGVLDLAELNDPRYIMIGFDTRTTGLGIIDQIGWPVIDLKGSK